MAVLLPPVVVQRKANAPIAILLHVVDVTAAKVCAPIAILQFPDVLQSKANGPNAIL
jgi:hypothetical protein